MSAVTAQEGAEGSVAGDFLPGDVLVDADVAGEAELRQVLARGVPGERIILSAAVKPAALLDLAVRAGHAPRSCGAG